MKKTAFWAMLLAMFLVFGVFVACDKEGEFEKEVENDGTTDSLSNTVVTDDGEVIVSDGLITEKDDESDSEDESQEGNAYNGVLEFTSNGDGTCYVSGNGEFSGENLNIPAFSPKGEKVISIGEFAFEDCSEIVSVTISYGIVSIESAAFRDCENLTTVSVDDSVVFIKDSAFENCVNLINIDLPNSVTHIGKYAFENCTALESIKIPDNITSIEYGVFFGCENLKSVSIPDEIVRVSNAFNNCPNLIYTEYKNAYYLGNDKNPYLIFMNIGSGEEIQIHNQTKIIYGDAFRNCEILESIDIPDGITYIGSYAFAYCKNLKSVYIPNSVKFIDNYVFWECSKLENISIPNGIESIGSYSFECCNRLHYNGDNGLYYLGNEKTPFLILMHVGNGSEYNISSETKHIHYAAFSDCSNLVNLTIPEGVESIGDFAFVNCTSLESVILPNSIKSMGIKAFDQCIKLKTVYFVGTKEEWNEIEFHSSLPETLTVVCDYVQVN